MRTAVPNEDSVVEDGDPLALPFAPSRATRNMVISAGAAVQVFASGSDTLKWPQQATPQSQSVIVPAGSSLTFWYFDTYSTWYVVAEGSVPISYPPPTTAFTAAGQLLVGTGAGTGELLPLGSTGTVLTVGGADASGLEWSPLPAGLTVAYSTNWTTLSLTGTPSARSFVAVDTSYFGSVQFGGLTSGGVVQDTYTFSGATWTLKSPATKPSARQAAGVSQTSGANYILFGGLDGSSTKLSDTYTWNGTNWTLKSPAGAPSARYGHSMVNDPSSGVILVGGLSGTSTRDGATWQWNGATWTNLALAMPTPVSFGAICLNQSTNRVWFFGGDTGTGVGVNNMYYWEAGIGWVQVFSEVTPPARWGANLMYESNTGYLVLFGGESSGTYFNDTWMFNGSQWWQVESSPATSLSARAGAMGYCDSGTTGAFVWGGTNASGQLSDGQLFTPIIGPPQSGGPYTANELYIDANSQMWLCVAGGSPGTWIPTSPLQVASSIVPGQMLAYLKYDPGSNTNYSLSAVSFTQLDATNLVTAPFVAPPSGKVKWSFNSLGAVAVASTDSILIQPYLLPLASAVGSLQIATQQSGVASRFLIEDIVTGLTPGAIYTLQPGYEMTAGTGTLYGGGVQGAYVQTVTAL